MTQSLHDRLQQNDLINTSDDYAAEVLNAPDTNLPTAQRDVPTKAIRRYLTLKGKMGAIEVAARGSDALAALCINVITVLEPGAFVDLDYDEAETVGVITYMCDQLVQAGLLSSDDKTYILGMGTYYPSWAEVNLGRPTTEREVSLYR